MKFKKFLLKERDEYPQNYYINYPALKKQIKYICGLLNLADVSEVTNFFGNVPALGGPYYRPPDSRFQEVIQEELRLVSIFTETQERAIFEKLLTLLRRAKSIANKVLKGLELNSDQTICKENQTSTETSTESSVTKFQTITTVTPSVTPSEIISLLQDAQLARSNIQGFDSYIRINFNGFRKIMKKYDKTRLRVLQDDSNSQSESDLGPSSSTAARSQR